MFEKAEKCASAKFLAVLGAVAVALVLAASAVSAQPAYADSTGYTATATPYYRNPATGAIEDSGGESSEVLGQSMTESATYPAAFVELDDAGNRYVTLRLSLIDNIQNVSILVDDNWTAQYYQANYEIVQYDSSASTADFRFLANDEGAIFRINMYVIPMGREVIFYVALSNFSQGNPYGFAMVGSTSSSSADGSGISAQLGGGGAVAASGAAAGADAASEAEASAEAATDAAVETSDGLAEFDSAGNKVETEADDAEQADGTVSVPVGVLAGAAVALVVIAAAAVWFFGVYRPRHASSSQAVLAAEAAASGEGAFRPYEQQGEAAAGAGMSASRAGSLGAGAGAGATAVSAAGSGVSAGSAAAQSAAASPSSAASATPSADATEVLHVGADAR